jgi:hypothetical protein
LGFPIEKKDKETEMVVIWTDLWFPNKTPWVSEMGMKPCIRGRNETCERKKRKA